MARLTLTRRAKEQLVALPRVAQEAMEEALLQLAADPPAAGIELRGRLRGTWRMTVPGFAHGGYRVLYKIRPEAVIVESILPRLQAYGQHHR